MARPDAAPGAPAPPFDADPSALDVLAHLWRNGHAAYLVGGAVRDALLGHRSHDWDVATDARPERILQLFEGSSYENRFGTVLAAGVEITTFRSDHRYADHRRPERVTFGHDLEEDLARRDFTVNAIAWGRPAGSRSRPEGDFVDPHGGREDLAAGVLRAVGDPDARFEEDALRLIRAARIAAVTGLGIESRTLAAMATHAPDVSWVSAERVGIEVRRMLGARTPSLGFRTLSATGILGHVLPEVSALRGLEHPARPGQDLLDHAFATMDAAAVAPEASERLLLAALLHDAGWQAGGGESGVTQSHAARGAPLAAAAVERLRLPSREASEVGRLVAWHGAGEEIGGTDAAVRRFIRSVHPSLVEDVLRLRRADDVAAGRDPTASGTDALAERVAAQLAARVPLSLADLAVDGHDLQRELGLSPGPALGRLLELLLESVLDDPARNTRHHLLTRARSMRGDPGWPGGRTGVGSPQ
jgi:tRNA nucleotidyltransferase (CCA-adding enzyme)